MRSFLVFGFLFLFLLLMFPLHLILVLIGKMNIETRYKIGNSIVYWAFRWELLMAGAKIEVKGLENIPKESVLFVSNHRSYFDILVLHTTTTKRPGFVAKKEMEHYPFLNGWMKSIACLFLDRNDLRSGIQMIKDGAQAIKNGHSMVIFPEGHRNQENIVNTFKEGSLKIAEKANCAIVPVTLVDTDQLLEARSGYHIKGAKVKVVFDKPIYLKDFSREEKKKAGAYVHDIIENTMKKEKEAMASEHEGGKR